MTVLEAVASAKNHLVTVLPEYASADLQLEELETSPFSSKWSFTFSITFQPSSTSLSSLADVLRGRRVSKSVNIDPETGSLLSIKNAIV